MKKTIFKNILAVVAVLALCWVMAEPTDDVVSAGWVAGELIGLAVLAAAAKGLQALETNENE